MPTRKTLLVTYAIVCLYAWFAETASAQSRRRQAQPPAHARSFSGAPAAKWAGHTGEDFAGKATTLGSNGIQDIRIDVVGIPAGQVSSIVLKGHGGGEWQWARDGKPPGGWAIHMLPDPAGNAAALFFESGLEETGREFELKWTVPGKPERCIYFPGGKSDPTKPVASARITARWIGQDAKNPVDVTNPSPAVGPDGFEDVVIELAGISERDEVAAVDVRTSDDKLGWAFGVNPKGAFNAELIRVPHHAPTAKLILALPTGSAGSIAGRQLEVRLRYASAAVTEATVEAGPATAAKPMPPVPMPKLIATKVRARWLGPMARSKAGAGAVRLELAGMQNDPRVISALLTDDSGAIFATSNAKTENPASPLFVERTAPDKAMLDFVPGRELEGQPLSLRLNYSDGSMGILDLEGGATQPERRIPPLASSRTSVRPGQDLQAVVARGGTVLLADGTYELQSTLTLDRPVRIEAAEGAAPVLNFTAGGGAPWRAAIKIRSGGVSLSGLKIRFSGPIEWKYEVAYGPAVIATTDPEDRGFDHDATHWGVVLEKLELAGPPQPGSEAKPAEAVRAVKMLNAALGRIEGCVIRGGTVHLEGGPWTIAANRHDGPLPGTFSYDAFAVTRPLDLKILSNRVEPVRGSGKLWRFLNLTQQGYGVRVEGNIVRNVGPRKDDSIEDMNANEILLTESYRLKFEGVPAGIAADRSVVVLPDPPGGPPAPGDAVTILTGDQAGQFVTVTQNLGGGAIQVRPAFPKAAKTQDPPAISVATGFRETRIVGNTIDATGSDNAFNLCLAGNHFGTTVTDNMLTGGGESLRITAFPTESPNVWGWSHAPMAGLTIRGNKIRQAALPARVATDQGLTIKTSAGRSYFSAELAGNTFEASAAGPALRVGDPQTLDPDSNVVILEDNSGAGTEPEVEIVSGRVNGRKYVNQRVPLVEGSRRR